MLDDIDPRTEPGQQVPRVKFRLIPWCFSVTTESPLEEVVDADKNTWSQGADFIEQGRTGTVPVGHS